MRTVIFRSVVVISLFAYSGCASNPDMTGQVISGILKGIGAGLSGL